MERSRFEVARIAAQQYLVARGKPGYPYNSGCVRSNEYLTFVEPGKAVIAYFSKHFKKKALKF